jgi:uncharacterized protein (DUF302 family)
MNKLIQYAFISFVILLSACTNESNQIFEKSTNKSFAEVIQDSEFAITENNFRITNRLHIGDAIQKRGNTDFPQNEVILFCNLTMAEEMLKIEPRYINYCPYKITATEFEGKTLIGTRLLPIKTDNKEMDKIAKKINKTLRLMVEYASSEDPFILD